MSIQPPYKRQQKKHSAKGKRKATAGDLTPLESNIQKFIIRYTITKYSGAYNGLKCVGDPLSSMNFGNMKNKHAFIAHAKAMGWQSGHPDIAIYRPNSAFINGVETSFAGLFLELKRNEKESPFYLMPQKKIRLIDNETEKGAHLREQAVYLADLQQSGYMGLFGVGQQQAQDIIDWYLGNKKLTFEKFEFNAGRYIPQKYWIWKVV